MSDKPQINCEWAEDADGSVWETSCHNRFLLNDGGPTENGLKFCPFCGRNLVEIHVEEENP